MKYHKYFQFFFSKALNDNYSIVTKSITYRKKKNFQTKFSFLLALRVDALLEKQYISKKLPKGCLLYKMNDFPPTIQEVKRYSINNILLQA